MHKPNRLAQLIIGIRLMFLILNPANALRDVPRMGLWISFLLVSRLKGCSVGELGVARHVARSMGHRRTHTHTHTTPWQLRSELSQGKIRECGKAWETDRRMCILYTLLS